MLGLCLPLEHWLGCCCGLPLIAKGRFDAGYFPRVLDFSLRRDGVCVLARAAVLATSPAAAPAEAEGPAQVVVVAQVLRAAVHQRAPGRAVVPGMQVQTRRAARVGAAALETRMGAQRAAPPAAGRTSSVFTRVAVVRSERALLRMTAGSVRADGPSPQPAFNPAAWGRDANRRPASHRHRFAQNCRLVAPALRLAAVCPGISVNNPAGNMAENAGS